MTTNTEIIQAATRNFRDKGYHGTSMQDIADAVGLLKGSLYHHIASKQELLHIICSRGMNVAIEPLEQIAASDLSPELKLKRAVRNHIETLTLHLDEAVVFLREERHLSPESRQAIAADRERFEQIFRQIVQNGIDAGQFRPVDASIVTKAILGITNGIVQWYAASGRLGIDEIAEVITDFILNGLAAWVDPVPTASRA